MHFFDESFWLAISFFIFIYFAYKPVRKAVLGNLDKKIEEVKVLVFEAENLKKDSAILLLKTQNEINELGKIRDQILKEAELAAATIGESRKVEINALLEQNKMEAISSIDQLQTKFHNKIKQDFMELTKRLVEEYLKESNNNNSKDIEIAENFIRQNLKD